LRTGTVLVLAQNAAVLETSARLLRLLGLFQSRPAWRAPELAVRLDVTERTVRRDVARLRDLGYPVQARPGIDGGYRLGPGTTVPPLLLDDDEVVAVAVGLSAAADGSVGGLDEAAVRALTKLERVLPARLRPRLASVRAATVALGPGGPAVDAEALTVLATACDVHERVRFGYVTRDGSAGERTVEPHRLVLAGRRWYLVARDLAAARAAPDADPWRTYRLDRISSVTRTGVPFRPGEAPDAAGFVAHGVSTRAYRWQLRALLDAPADAVAALVPSTVGVVEAVDEQSCVFVSGSDSLESLALHLGLLGAQLGVAVRVLEPPELRPVLRRLSGYLAAAAGPSAD
jgi:predicted DNA-binding transcriptional regulator YafY